MSQADLRYQPLVKNLSEVVYFPVGKPEMRPLLIKILDNLIKDGERTS